MHTYMPFPGHCLDVTLPSCIDLRRSSNKVFSCSSPFVVTGVMVCAQRECYSYQQEAERLTSLYEESKKEMNMLQEKQRQVSVCWYENLSVFFVNMIHFCRWPIFLVSSIVSNTVKRSFGTTSRCFFLFVIYSIVHA